MTAARQPAMSDAAFPRPGDRIGPYELIDVLGEGGMGTVFLAEQREPVRRRVALKVIKPGLDSDQVLQRFAIERQALAVMSHEGIAKVLDCGSTPRGQPYFAMEYVRGVPITEYCDRNRLPLEARIRLFQQVCQAVQHAHHKGVVHRDLKPANILVADHDGEPQPKVIDFGLARATDHLLLQGTMFTQLGQILGTPEYMSPEQADPSATDVDTRTDIYSLGVVLYELLTGLMPLPAEELRRNGLLEMQRQIREREPVRPSTRLRAEQAAAMAAARRLDAPGLERQLRGDLDWIVMKAIDKDRTRRYATALEFDADLARHLADEPVAAGPPSAGYRLQKFVRRHRLQVIAAAAVLLAVALGATAAVLFGLESAAQARVARIKEGEALAHARIADERALLIGQQKEALRLLHDEAVRRGEEAEGRRLLALAARELERDPELALLLAEEGHGRAPSPELRDLLVASLLASGMVRSFPGHASQVQQIAFSGDGRLLFTGDSTGVVIAWDFATGRRLHTLSTCHAAVRRLRPDAAGDSVVVLTADRTASLWRTASADPEVTLALPDWPYDVEPRDGPGVVLRTWRGYARAWDVAGRSLPSPEGPMLARTIGRNGRQAVRVAAERSAANDAVVELGSGATVFTFPAEASGITGACFAADASILATVNNTSRIRIWSTSSWQLVREFHTAFDSLASVQISGDGRWLVASSGIAETLHQPLRVAGSGRSIQVFDLTTSARHWSLEFELSKPNLWAWALSPDSLHLVLAAGSEPVRALALAAHRAPGEAGSRQLSSLERESYGLPSKPEGR